MEEIEIEKDMIPKLIGETWRKYPTETSMQKATYGLFECQYCKKEFEAQSNNIKHGLKSCGCQRKGINKTHGLAYNKFYKTWKGMRGRCTNPKAWDYKYYGARGITVCEEWLNVSNFVAWCDLTHPNIEGLTLDRIDSSRGYSPENCRWVDKSTQVINQRIRKDNKSGVVGVHYHKGNVKWAAYISVTNTRKHIGYFDSIEEAVLARDNYIIKNGLPHKLSGLTKN